VSTKNGINTHAKSISEIIGVIDEQALVLGQRGLASARNSGSRDEGLARRRPRTNAAIGTTGPRSRGGRGASDKKNPQVVDLLGGSGVFWWSWGESNPRPKAIAGQIYMLSWLIWF